MPEDEREAPDEETVPWDCDNQGPQELGTTEE
jgi:hypothetical protein